MRVLFILLGLLCMGLGAVGAFLPILPTVPFLLLALFFFGKSSARLETWLKGTQLYRTYLADLSQGRGMTRKAKAKTILTVTLVMAIAFVMMRRTLVGRICLAVVWVCHLIAFLFFIKTRPEGEPSPAEPPAQEIPVGQVLQETLEEICETEVTADKQTSR